MITLRLVGLTLLCLLGSLVSADAVGTKHFILLADVVANKADAEPIVTASYTTGVIHVCCTFDATVNILFSGDGENFETLECISVSDRNSRGTSMIARGGMRCNLIGIGHLKLTVTNYISGTINASIDLASAGVY